MSERREHHRVLRRALVGVIAGAGLWSAQGLTQAQTTSSICEADGGYVVAYYNNTFALPEDADAQRAALRIARHGKYDGTKQTITKDGKAEPVYYETFYSTSDTATSGSRLSALADEYRKALDGALAQGQYWEYFWDLLDGNTAYWGALADKAADSRFTALTTSFPALVRTQAATAVSALQTALDSSTALANIQTARAQALYTERQKLTLVGYGAQGKLFADKGFAKIGAPADSSALRLDVSSKPGTSDGSTLTAKMAALVTPTNLANNKGFFTATLSWSVPAAAIGTNADGTVKQNDFDLHVIEPDPPARDSTYVQWVHFTETGDAGKGGGGSVSKQGYAGYLDKDSKGLSATDIGPEHYYASCDETKLLPGTYWIAATKLKAQIPDQTSITLQIATAKSGEVYSKTFTYTQLPEFIQQSKLTFPVKVVLKKNADGTWAKPEVTAFDPLATYEITGLPTSGL